MPYKKGLEYVKKHGYLRLICDHCHEEFTCSGHCLKEQRNLERQVRNTCLCGKCDESKTSERAWYSKCKKDFPFTLLREVLLRDERKS